MGKETIAARLGYLRLFRLNATQPPLSRNKGVQNWPPMGGKIQCRLTLFQRQAKSYQCFTEENL